MPDFKEWADSAPEAPLHNSSFNKGVARQMSAMKYGGANKSRTLAGMV
jgi:hypothetical protein